MLLNHLLNCVYRYIYMHIHTLIRTPKREATSKSLICIHNFTFYNSKIAKRICLSFVHCATVLSESLWVSFKALNNRGL